MYKTEEINVFDKYIVENSVKKLKQTSNLSIDKIRILFSTEKLKKHISDNYPTMEIGNYKDLFEFYSKINPICFFSENLKNDEYFDCYFRRDSFSWISKDSKEVYRYFSKERISGDVLAFNLVDLFEIYTGLMTFRALDKMNNELDVKFMQDKWMNGQREKYFYNISSIHSINDTKMSKELKKIIKPFLKHLQVINSIGMSNIRVKELSYKNDSVFFFSTQYLAKFTGDNQSTISKILNYLALLGFINKIPMEHVPQNYRFASYRKADEGVQLSHINYYSVILMDEAIEVAEKRLPVLEDNKIRYSNLSKDKVEALWGMDLANSLYPQETKRKKTAEPVINTKSKEITKIIKTKLKTKTDFLLRETLIELCEENGISKNFIIQNWNILIKDAGCDYFKVSKTEQQKYGLDKQNYILVKKRK